MTRKWSVVLSVFVVLLTATLMLSLASCGHDQELTQITVQPATETFGAANVPVNLDAGLSVQLRALGTYIHPPVTKDITGQVTWFSNTPQMVTVNSTGMITATGGSCGGTLVSATMKSQNGGIQTAFMTANVVCFSGTGQALTLLFSGAGSGTVTSSPSGLSCASTCSGAFPTGTPVVLTAAATGTSTFGGWGGCDTVAGAVCTVNLTTNRTVTVTFN